MFCDEHGTLDYCPYCIDGDIRAEKYSDLIKAASDLLNRLDLNKEVERNGWWKDERDCLATAIINARQ